MSEDFQTRLKEFKSLSSAFFPTTIVLSAIELGVFGALDAGRASSDVLAERLGVPQRSLHVLLNALAALGYVVREGDTFENSAFSARALVSGKPDYQGDSALLSLWFMRLAGGLTEAVRSGAPTETFEEAVTRSAGRGAILVRAMDQIAGDFVEELKKHVALEGVRTVLDVGGAAGTLVNAIIESDPNVQGTVFELPHAAAEARRIISARGWSERMTVHEGDYRKDDLGGPYDIAFASNVFHLLDATAAKALVHKMADALAPGGRLIIKDMIGRDDGGDAPGLATYSVLMLLISRGGALHGEGSYEAWCTDAGLRAPRRIDCWERSSLLIAEKPEKTRAARTPL